MFKLTPVQMTKTLLIVFTVGFLLSPVWLQAEPGEESLDSPSNETLKRFNAIPLHFEENRGQFDEQVRYVARGLGYQLLLTPDERIVLVYQPTAAEPSFKSGNPSTPQLPAVPQAYAVRMQFDGANKDVTMESEGELASKVNYLRGRDREQWVRKVSTFQKVRSLASS